MEVRACTVAEHCAGEAACTTSGSAVRESSHSVWRCSSSGEITRNSSVAAEATADTGAAPAPE